MDRIYRHQRSIYDVTRKYYLLGRDRLIADLSPPQGGLVLEAGCGTARNLVAVARRYPDATLHGFDVSTAMLDTARAAVSRAGLGARIRLAQADATRFEPGEIFGVDGFDRVFLSYTLSMIPDWRSALLCAAQALRPGGRLAIVDFGQMERLPRWFRTAMFAWLARFHVYPHPDLAAELEAVAAAQGLSLSITRPFGTYAIAATLQRPG